jgi:hypothetical protein
VARGVQWLLQHQLSDGGWGQGDESPQMRSGQPAALAATSNVADSSMALLALLRAGHTPSSGAQQAAVRRGVAYVLREIEASDKDSLFVTSVRGTRVQGKIGTYVDTFAGLMLLSEIKGAMPDAAGNRRVDAALAKVLSKIEKNQTADGGFRNQGWAPALTQSLATKGLNRAAQKGQAVSEQVLERAEKNAQGRFDGAGRGFSSDDAAGVDLYSGAGALSAMRDSVSTRKGKYKRWQQQAAEPGSPEATRARRALRESEVAERTANDAEGALIARLDDPAFVGGFGSNGGEEFLSYMLVSESLVQKGGKPFRKWHAAISALIYGVQNADGSWTGHHCITGRTFCTATALLVLMADRSPVPIASQLRHG